MNKTPDWPYFDPITGDPLDPKNGPFDIADTRPPRETRAWEFNPTTGVRRSIPDINADPWGLRAWPAVTAPTKESNPKEAIGDSKVPLWLLSPIAKVKWAMAQFAGLVKYGAWNWRAAGVRASTYLSAIERHLDGYKSGEELDPTDGTDHLGNIMACCAILIEARAAGKLTDDRPPRVDHRPAIAEAEALMVKLKAQYADKNPRHWTLADDVSHDTLTAPATPGDTHVAVARAVPSRRTHDRARPEDRPAGCEET